MSDENGNGNGNGNVKSRFVKLTSDIELLKTLLNKLDKNVDKLADASVEVSKLISKHDVRIENNEHKSEHLNNEIHDLNMRILDIHKEIKEVSYHLSNTSATNIDKLSNKVQNIERWKWYAGGAILAIAMGMEYESIAKILLKVFG
jgi:methyl-accepting chemotaxis protein